MADDKVQQAEDSAEKAYAAAAEAVVAGPGAQSAAEELAAEVKAPVEVSAEPAPVEFPAKAQRTNKSRAAAEPAVAVSVVKPVAPASVAKAGPRKPAATKPQPPVKAPVKAKAVSKAKPAKKARAATPPRKPTASKPAVAAAPKPAPKPDKITVTTIKKTPTVSQLKDKIMATTKTPDFTKGIQDAIADAQSKAKVAFEKGTSSFGEISEFTKGNVEALVESGKIFAAGIQDLSSSAVTESRTAFETLSADVKELTSVKTPADFFKLQSELLRRSFDAAVAAGSKNSEAVLKLTNEAFAPISGRLSLAIDKVKKAA